MTLPLRQFFQLLGEPAQPFDALLMAQLAYNSLHDSALKFDRSTPIERRYAHVQRACAQAFADWNRE